MLKKVNHLYSLILIASLNPQNTLSMNNQDKIKQIQKQFLSALSEYNETSTIKRSNLECEQIPTLEDCFKKGMTKKEAIQEVISTEIANRQRQEIKKCEHHNLSKELPYINGILYYVSLRLNNLSSNDNLDESYNWAIDEIKKWDKENENRVAQGNVSSLFD